MFETLFTFRNNLETIRAEIICEKTLDLSKQLNNRIFLLLILMIGILLRIYVDSDGFLHCWDERYHALVAKHLMQHPLTPTLYEQPLLPYSLSEWTSNHVWVHKQPLPLWAMAFTFRLFGLSEFNARVPSLLLSCISVLLCYGIGRKMYNERVGLFAAIFCTVSGIGIDLCSGRMATDHPDLFLYFFVLAGVYTGQTAANASCKTFWVWVVLTGVSAGAAMLSKWLPGLLIFPVLFVFWPTVNAADDKRKYIALLVSGLVAFAVFAPWQWYIGKHFPLEAKIERDYNLLHFSHELSGQGGPWYYFLNRMRIDYGELIYLPLIYAIAKTFRNKFAPERALLVWIALPLIVFSVAATKMPGYLFVAAPAFFLLSAAFTDKLLNGEIRIPFNWLRILLIAAFFALPLRYCIERAKFFQNDRNPMWVDDLKRWSHAFPARAEHCVLLGYKAPIEAMFYTNCIAYDYFPEEKEIRRLQDLG